MAAGLLLLAYYDLAFLLEEDLFCALWAGGVRLPGREKTWGHQALPVSGQISMSGWFVAVATLPG